MDAEIYPDKDVSKFIIENFIPVRAHVKEQPEVFERFGAQWTPTVLILEPDGTERYRFEGFLPKADFLAQLRLGLAHTARARGEFDLAAKRYDEIAENRESPADAAAEALYWAGVSRYKGNGDGAALGATAKAFQSRFTDSPWAKKASIWAA